MTDIARLAYAVDSSQLKQANRELDKNTKAAGKASTATEKMEREASKMGKAWGVFAGLSISAGVLAVTRTLTNAAQAASEFQQAMAEVSTLLSDTSGIERTSKEVRELTKQFGGSAQGQAKALYNIISAGASDTAEALDILTASNKLAIGGVTDVATAADGLTSIMNAYAGSAGSATDVSDALFVAMRGGKTTIAELSAAVGQVAPIAATVGVSFDELSAAIAAVTTGGVQTSVAVTQLRAVLSAVLKPTADAQKVSKQLGIDFTLTGLKAKGLAEFLDDVRKKTGGNQATMASLFGSVESLGAVFALTGGQAETFTRLLEQQAEKAGQTEEAYAKMSDTGVQKYARLKAVATDALIEVGNQLLDNTDAVDQLTDSLNDPALINGLTEVVRLLAEAGNAAVTAAGKIGEFIGKYRQFLADRGLQTADESSSIGQIEARIEKEQAILERIEGGRTIWGKETAGDLRESIAAAEELLKLKKEADAPRRMGNIVSDGTSTTSAPRSWLNEMNPTDATTSPTVDLGGGSSGKKALSDQEKAANRLLSTWESMNESLQERIALHGQDGMAVQVKYDIENGALQGIDEAKAQQLLKDAQHIDLLDEAAEIEQIWADTARDHAEIVEDRTRAFERVNQEILDQIELIGMSRDEQEVWNNLVWAGVEAESARGQEIIKNTELLQQMRDVQRTQVDMMDALRGSARSFADDLYEGVGIWDSLKSAAGDFADQLYQIATDQLIAQLFGKQGDSGGGAYGDLIGSFFGSLFGGGRAYGGDVRGDRFYRVGEGNQPELANIGGRQYMIPGDQGRVMPMNGAGGGGPTVSQTIHNHYQHPYDARTESHKNQKMAEATSRAVRRNS